jgi:hypothetical protein
LISEKVFNAIGRKMSKRVLNVSDRFYSLINYGAKTYGVSKTEFCDMLYESQVNLIKDRCKLIKLENGKKIPLFEEKEKKIPSVSEYSKLMEEGLKLMEEINPQKAKELKEQLEELREKRKEEKHTAL